MAYKVIPFKFPLCAQPPPRPLFSNLPDWQKYLMNNGWPLHSFDFPVEVIPRLWLSGVAFNTDLPSWCQSKGFTHIVNAAGYPARFGYYKTHPYYDHKIKYLELDMEDVSHFELGSLIPKSYEFIRDAYNTGGKILVHCMWGQSRSVACLIYFLMMNKNIDYDTALSIIKKTRPRANPNRGFELQLRSMEISRCVLQGES